MIHGFRVVLASGARPWALFLAGFLAVLDGAGCAGNAVGRSAEAEPKTAKTGAEAASDRTAEPLQPSPFRTALQRELPALPELQAVESKAGEFRTRVPGTPGLIKQTPAKVQLFELAIGVEAPVRCFVYPNALDLAHALNVFSDGMRLSLDEQADLLNWNLARTDAGAVGSSPFLGGEWVYQMGSEDAATSGLFKTRVGTKDGRSLLCVHDAIGYRKTFERVFATVLQNLENLQVPEVPQPDPFYTEVSALSIGGHRVGFERLTFRRDSDGAAVIERISSMAIPTDPTTLYTVDSYRREIEASDGELLAVASVEREGSEIVTELQLARTEANVWSVAGKYKSKPIEAEIIAQAPPTATLRQMRETRRALREQGAGSTVDFAVWLPDADPTRFVTSSVSVGERREGGGFEARVSSAGVEAETVLDESGSTLSGSVEVGASAFVYERIYAGGSF